MNNTHEYINISETPDKWVVIKVPDGHKIFASWAGGYLDGDRWRLNSGIEKVEEDDKYYYFFGYSGSCYKCRKGGYGVMTSYSQGILDTILSQRFVELLEEDRDWMEYFKLKSE